MTRRTAAKLHLLTVREVQTAPEGDHTDGGGLMLRVRGDSASWVLRYTAISGRRREMGLGVAQRACRPPTVALSAPVLMNASPSGHRRPRLEWHNSYARLSLQGTMQAGLGLQLKPFN